MNKYQIAALHKLNALLGIPPDAEYPREWKGQSISMIPRESWIEAFDEKGHVIAGVAVEYGNAILYKGGSCPDKYTYIGNGYLDVLIKQKDLYE